MTWTIAGAKSKWSVLSKVEKDYLYTLCALGSLFAVAELLRGLSLPFKYVYLTSFLLVTFLGIYLMLLPNLLNSFRSKLPFGKLNNDQQEWLFGRNWIIADIMGIISISIINFFVLDEAYFWVRIIFTFIFLIMFLFGFLYNDRKNIEQNADNQYKYTLGKILKIVGILFLAFLVIVVYMMAYHGINRL